MFIQVQGCNDGHDGRWRAGRYFPNAAPRLIEVLDTDDDPPQVEHRVNGKFMGMKADPDRIGRRSLAELRADNCLRIMSDTETDGAAAHAAINDAKRVASEKAGALAQAEIEIASLNSRIAALETEKADLTKQLADAKAGADADKTSTAGVLADAKLEIAMLSEENSKLVARLAALSADAKVAKAGKKGAAEDAKSGQDAA